MKHTSIPGGNESRRSANRSERLKSLTQVPIYDSPDPESHVHESVSHSNGMDSVALPRVTHPDRITAFSLPFIVILFCSLFVIVGISGFFLDGYNLAVVIQQKKYKGTTEVSLRKNTNSTKPALLKSSFPVTKVLIHNTLHEKLNSQAYPSNNTQNDINNTTAQMNTEPPVKIQCPPLHDRSIPWTRLRPLSFFDQDQEDTSNTQIATDLLKRFHERYNANLPLLVERFIAIGSAPQKITSATLNTSQTNPFSVYYHIHKVGGTAMDRALSRKHMVLPVQRYYWPEETQMGSDVFKTRTRAILELLFQYQQEENLTSKEAKGSFFTFLRDPLDKFVSAVGQVLVAENPPDFAVQCAKETSTQTMFLCVLRSMISNTTTNDTDVRTPPNYLNEHLLPQSVELYHGLLGVDLIVDVVQLSFLDKVLDGCMSSQDYDKDKDNTTLPIRSGLIQGQQKFPQFNFQNATSVFTLSMLQDVCDLYEADVLLLRYVASLQGQANSVVAPYCP